MTATTPRKVQTRRPAPARDSGPAQAAGPATPISAPLLVIGQTPPEEPRYEVLFEMDGTGYEMLVNPAPADMNHYLHLSRTDGINVAFDWAMETMLSEGAYEVLRTDRRVSKDDFRRLSVIIVQTLMGVDRKDAVAAAEEVVAGMIPKYSPNGRRR